MTMLIGITLIPLIAFAILNYYKGLKFGVYSGMIASVLLGLGLWVFFDYFDYDLVLMVVLLFTLGLVSLKTENELYFKLQPVISAVLWVLLLSWYQIFDEPFLLRLTGKMGTLLPPEQLQMLELPEVRASFARMTAHGIFWILLHTILLGYAAVKWSTTRWLIIKALFLPWFFICVLVTELALRFLAI